MLEGGVTALSSCREKIAKVTVRFVWSVFSKGKLSSPEFFSSGSLPCICCMTKFIIQIAVQGPGWILLCIWYSLGLLLIRDYGSFVYSSAHRSLCSLTGVRAVFS